MDELNLNSTVELPSDCNSKKSFFRRLYAIMQRIPAKYLAFSFIIPIVIMYIIYVAMEIHPFGDGSVLVLDLNGQYVYFYEALRNFVYGDTSLLYSFSRAMGGEFLGIYSYYIASPFSYIVCLFPQTRMLEALLCIFLLKTGLCGFTFGYYIHKTKKTNSKIITVIFSLMYALCAYAVVQQHNSMWIDAVMWLPLISFGIEQLIERGKFRMYVIFLALTMMSNFYIGYMVCFYCVAYFFYYYFSHMSDGINNPSGEKFHFIKSSFRFGAYSLLAAGIAAVILLSAYYSLTFGKTTFTNPSWDFALKFDLLELFSKLLPGSYDTVRPEGLPFIYCGMLAIILLPIFFMSPKNKPSEKIMSGLLILFFVLSFSISVVDLVWHGFQRPNWLNYRYSFMLSFFLLSLACKSFDDLKEFSNKTVFAICSGLAVLVIILQAMNYQYVDDLEAIWFSLVAIAIYLIIIYFIKTSRRKANMMLILAFAVSFELFANGLLSVVALDKDVVYSGYSGYNNFLATYRPIVNNVLDNDTSFYRMEKTEHRKTNDNMALNIRGVSNSTSTLNADTLTFLREWGYCSKSHWCKYAGGTPVSDSLIGLKYILAREDLSDLYEPISVDGDITTYLNPYALSIAYAVNPAISELKYEDYDTPMDFFNALITAMLGETEKVEVFVPVKLNSKDTNAYCDDSYIAGHFKYAKNTENYDAQVFYNFTSPTEQDLFFYFASDYPREVKLKINGKSFGTFNGSDTSRIISVGKGYEIGSEINLTMTLVHNDLYIKDWTECLYYIDHEIFKDAMAQLSEIQYQIDDYTERSFEGTIATKANNTTILTTIPYDKGWRVFVDGELVEIYESLDALVAFDINTLGDHDVKIFYLSDAFALGASISIISVLIFIPLCILQKKLCIRKKNEESNANTIDDNQEVSELTVNSNSSVAEALEIQNSMKGQNENVLLSKRKYRASRTHGGSYRRRRRGL